MGFQVSWRLQSLVGILEFRSDHRKGVLGSIQNGCNEEKGGEGHYPSADSGDQTDPKCPSTQYLRTQLPKATVVWFWEPDTPNIGYLDPLVWVRNSHRFQLDGGLEGPGTQRGSVCIFRTSMLRP